MIPPNNYFDHNLDLAAYYKKLADSYAVSITQSGVKRLVHLSSIGAHLSSGNGILSSTYAHGLHVQLNRRLLNLAVKL
ncbi:MAG: hypothetical protein EOO61_23295 [Hymenobacter sp.]|nr:MAG: hypothetical protein EOO61_23295 [Hymenobacter sp.]